MSRRSPAVVRRATPQRIRATRRRWPTCEATGKKRLGERKDARLILRAASAARAHAELHGLPTRRRECREYRCEHCRGRHLTSWPSRSRLTGALDPAWTRAA